MTDPYEAARPYSRGERTPPQRSAHRLSGLDASFLALELPEQPMHVVAVAVLRPADDGETSVQITLDDVRRRVVHRLNVLPALRLRVQPVPFGLHHPVFVEASDFDLDRHLSRAILPAPGGSQELDRLCASLAGSCLDRRHPLWHLTLVSGLIDGRQALVFAVHHCLMDGIAMRTMFTRLFADEDPQHGELCYEWRPEHPSGRWRQVVGAMLDQCGMVAGLPALVRKSRHGRAVICQSTAGSSIAVPRPGVDAPACALNIGYTPERRFARASLPLADVKLVKEVAGVSVNDVLLSVIAGALRDHLQQQDLLPDRPLIANVPVGMETPGDPTRAVGNRFTRLATSLATDMGDAWARLQTISKVTRESKRCLDLMGREVLGEWLDLLPPAITCAVIRRGYRRRRSHPNHLDTNVTISNIRGPAQPWCFGSAIVDEMFVTAPPNSGVGVTFAVWDYAGTLLVGILSFADSVADPGELASGLSRSLCELVAIAQCRRGSSTSLASGSAYSVRRGLVELPGSWPQPEPLPPRPAPAWQG
jgi:diacylglycerol O-acyltransferase